MTIIKVNRLSNETAVHGFRIEPVWMNGVIAFDLIRVSDEVIVLEGVGTMDIERYFLEGQNGNSQQTMSIRPICGHPYITKLTPDMSAEDIAFLKSGFCPECAEREAEFEIVAEAEYQLQRAWNSLQAVPAYTERCQRYHAGLSAFFQAVALLASHEVDPFCLNWEEANEWRELQDKWELIGER